MSGAPPSIPGGADAYLAWKDWSPDRFGAVRPEEARYFAWHLRRALGEAARHPGLDLLEIGFGNGAFLAWAAAHGHRPCGVELNPSLVATARARGFQVYASTGALEAEARFDLVAGFDVLEHLAGPELPAFLGDLAGRLKPGGALLLRFPNGDSPFGRANQHGDLSHLSTLGLAKVEQLCTLCGLTLAARGEAPWLAIHPNRPVRGVLRLVLRWALEKLLKFLYTERRLQLDPNMVVVLRRAGRPGGA